MKFDWSESTIKNDKEISFKIVILSGLDISMPLNQTVHSIKRMDTGKARRDRSVNLEMTRAVHAYTLGEKN